MKLRVIRSGDTLLMTDLPDAAKQFIDKQLKAGEAVTEAGVTQWLDEAPVTRAGQSGAAVYIWHADGNRIKVNRVLVTKQKTGALTYTPLGTAWRKYE